MTDVNKGGGALSDVLVGGGQAFLPGMAHSPRVIK